MTRNTNPHATDNVDDYLATLWLGGYIQTVVPESEWAYDYAHKEVTSDTDIIQTIDVMKTDGTSVTVDVTPVPVSARTGFVGAANIARLFGTMLRDGEVVYYYDPEAGEVFWSTR